MIAKWTSEAVRHPKSALWSNQEQRLAIFNRLAIAGKLLHDLATRVGFDFVHQLHGFDDAQYLPRLHHVAHFDKRRRPGRGRFVKGAYDRRAHLVHPSFRGRRLCRSGGRGSHGSTGHHRCRRRRRGHGKIAGLGRGGGRIQGALDAHFDIAALQLKFSDVLFYEKFDEFLELFLIHCRRWERSRCTPREFSRFKLPDLASYIAINSLLLGVRTSAPPRRTTTMSSIRTPPCPGTYTPGSTVTTIPSERSSRCPAANRGGSWISSPTPCPVE